MSYELHCMDALEYMATLADGSIDAIITDLPYGTTACAWDTVIPFTPMWEQVKRVLKPRGVFVTTASQPFTSALVMSNVEWFRYEWVWRKSRAGNTFMRNHQPLKFHENIVVFSPSPAHNSALNACAFYPQMEKRKLENARNNNPRMAAHSGIYGSNRTLGQSEANGFSPEIFPNSIIEVLNRETNLHPTQKPVALYAYLIRTYTNPGDTVLDFVMGSGTTGCAAVKEGRHFKGCDSDAAYVAIATKRLADAAAQPMLFEVTA